MTPLPALRTPTTRVVGVLFLSLFLSGSLLPGNLHAQATETRIIVRAVSHDAKIIGSGAGGVRVVIRRVRDGSVLADGVQTGGTGDTDSLMRKPRVRGTDPFDTPDAAAFRTTLALDAPTWVDITAIGPLGDPDGMTQATKRVLLIPGHHVEGDGFLVELTGLTVKIQEPRSEQPVPQGTPFTVRALMEMLCGCPTEPGGLWDSGDFTIQATVYRDGQPVATRPLLPAGTRSLYMSDFQGLEAGRYEIHVVATQNGTGNAGEARIRVSVQ
ncbi:MAG: hypothetical protein RIE53_07535 [Rhodothermales bacterium]